MDLVKIKEINVNKLTVEELKQVVAIADIIETVISQAKQRLIMIAIAEGVDGVEVKRTSGRRSWSKDTPELRAKLKELGIANPTVIKESVIALTEVEKTLGTERFKELYPFVYMSADSYKVKVIDADEPKVIEAEKNDAINDFINLGVE